MCHRKRFGDVVVGSQGEALHDVFVARFCGQHDNGLLPILLADTVTDFESIDTGQHDIEQNQVKLPA
jgi:hypothetical protein